MSESTNDSELPTQQGLSATAKPDEEFPASPRSKTTDKDDACFFYTAKTLLEFAPRKSYLPLFGRVRAKSQEDEYEDGSAPKFDFEANTVTMEDRKGEAWLTKLFDGNTENAEIFEMVMRPLCDRVLEGFNSLIFAYGQTGTGKTYTLLGKKSLGVKGMLTRAVEYFLTAANTATDVLIKVNMSAVEVYGTSPNKIYIYDLLDPQNMVKDWDEKRGKSGFDLKTITKQRLIAGNYDDLIMQVFNSSHFAPTAKNPDSTRGHLTWILKLEIMDKEDSSEKTVHLLVIDLAGSEGATALTPAFIEKVSKDVADRRRREAGVINHGLLQLAGVFKELRLKGQLSPTVSNGLRKVIHGFFNKKTYMRAIFMLSPYGVDAMSTLNTLKFINNIAKLKIKPTISKKKINIRTQNQRLLLRNSVLDDQVKELQDKLKSMKTRYSVEEARSRARQENAEIMDRLVGVGHMTRRWSVGPGLLAMMKKQQQFFTLEDEPVRKRSFGEADKADRKNRFSNRFSKNAFENNEDDPKMNEEIKRLEMALAVREARVTVLEESLKSERCQKEKVIEDYQEKTTTMGKRSEDMLKQLEIKEKTNASLIEKITRLANTLEQKTKEQNATMEIQEKTNSALIQKIKDLANSFEQKTKEQNATMCILKKTTAELKIKIEEIEELQRNIEAIRLELKARTEAQQAVVAILEATKKEHNSRMVNTDAILDNIRMVEKSLRAEQEKQQGLLKYQNSQTNSIQKDLLTMKSNLKKQEAEQNDMEKLLKKVSKGYKMLMNEAQEKEAAHIEKEKKIELITTSDHVSTRRHAFTPKSSLGWKGTEELQDRDSEKKENQVKQKLQKCEELLNQNETSVGIQDETISKLRESVKDIETKTKKYIDDKILMHKSKLRDELDIQKKTLKRQIKETKLIREELQRVKKKSIKEKESGLRFMEEKLTKVYKEYRDLAIEMREKEATAVRRNTYQEGSLKKDEQQQGETKQTISEYQARLKQIELGQWLRECKEMLHKSLLEAKNEKTYIEDELGMQKNSVKILKSEMCSVRKDLRNIKHIVKKQSSFRKSQTKQTSSNEYSVSLAMECFESCSTVPDDLVKIKQMIRKGMEMMIEKTVSFLGKMEELHTRVFTRSKKAIKKLIDGLIYSNKIRNAAIESKHSFIKTSNDEIDRLREEIKKMAGSSYT